MTGARTLSALGMKTPALLLYTRGASVPHLTRDVLETITGDSHVFQVPLLSTHWMIDGVTAQGEGLATFANFGTNRTYMTLQDPTVEVPQSHFEKYDMPLWSRTGKKLIDADSYMDAVEAFKPDIYVALCDAVTNQTSAKKRCLKSLERSNHMFLRCLERHNDSKLASNSLLLASIVGGFNNECRTESINKLRPYFDKLSGFVVDGLECNGPEAENISYDSLRNVVELITKDLPEDKPRIVHGCWNPETVLDLISGGCDVFDTSLPCLSTERGLALTFAFEERREYELDLIDQRFADDFKPISDDCSCPTCKKYTRAYINHLLRTKELLAYVLLQCHNLHHYFKFFEAIRASIASNRLSELRTIISEQYSTHAKQKSVKIDENAEERLRKKQKRL